MTFFWGSKNCHFSIFHLIFGCFWFWGPHNALLTGPDAWEWSWGTFWEVPSVQSDFRMPEADFRTQPNATSARKSPKIAKNRQKSLKSTISSKLDHFCKGIYEGKLFQMHYISVSSLLGPPTVIFRDFLPPNSPFCGGLRWLKSPKMTKNH